MKKTTNLIAIRLFSASKFALTSLFTICIASCGGGNGGEQNDKTLKKIPLSRNDIPIGRISNEYINLSSGFVATSGELILNTKEGTSFQQVIDLINSKGWEIVGSVNENLYQIDTHLKGEDKLYEAREWLENQGITNIATLRIRGNLNWVNDAKYHENLSPVITDGRRWNYDSINLDNAWKMHSPYAKTKLTIGIIDGAFRIDHEDLQIASNEILPNIKDDGKNRCEDETSCRAANHGMHVAGIIHASTNNQKGIAGIANSNDISLITMASTLEVDHVIASIESFSKRGVRVINFSGGSYICSKTKACLTLNNWERENIPINTLFAKAFFDISTKNPDILFVQASGNNGEDKFNSFIFGEKIYSDHTGYAASVASKENITRNLKNEWIESVRNQSLIVGAYHKNIKTNKISIAPYTQIPKNFNDKGYPFILAPGGYAISESEDSFDPGIFSLGYKNSDSYFVNSGTSMAAPHVSGVAAMLFQINPKLSAKNVRDIILDTADIVDGYRYLNAESAIKKALFSTAKQISPPFISTESGLHYNANTGEIVGLEVMLYHSNSNEFNNYEWSFSDGTPAFSTKTPTASFVFNKEGVVTVTVTPYSGTTAYPSSSSNIIVKTIKQPTENIVTPQIASSFGQSFAIKQNGTVWAWGNDGSISSSGENYKVLTPAQIGGLGEIKSISASGIHVLALRKDGTVFSWGNDLNGSLGIGLGTYPSLHLAYPSKLIGLQDIVAVTAGTYNSYAVKSDGTLWMWGSNAFNNLIYTIDTYKCLVADNPCSSIPKIVPNLDKVIAVESGYYTTTVLKSDGTVWSWGHNYDGLLGFYSYLPCKISTPFDYCTNSPTRVPGLSDIKSIAVQVNRALALKSDGTVWAWQTDGFGRIIHTPEQILSLHDIVAIANGDYNSTSLALKRDGTVYSWGAGPLGNGNDSSSKIPVQVKGLEGIIAIATGGSNSLALKKDGTVWAWGFAASGATGTNSKMPVTVYSPVQVHGLNNFGFFNVFEP